MTQQSSPPMLLTVREVTKLLRIQRPKVYELIKNGTVIGFKIGADWRVRRDSVEKLVGPISEGFFSKDSGTSDEDDEEEDQGKIAVGY